MMIRKTEYYQQIDMYLNDELTGEELREFNVELLINSSLAAEVELHREIQAAVHEQDIISLRSNLESLMSHKSVDQNFRETIVSEAMNYNFGLSNELSSFREFHKPVETNDLDSLTHSLPRIHLFQHEIAAKENIHQFYKEQSEETESAKDLLSPADEAIFAEVKAALQESDVSELRANLGQIAKGMPEHQWDIDEIEKYINHEMKPELISQLEEEMQFNPWLRNDVDLHKEIDVALSETDIIGLRASLDKIQGIEHSSSRRIEEIDKYLMDELNEDELVSFENELASNPGLMNEVTMFNEIDTALMETDVINLRANLQSIGKDAVKDKQRSIRMPISRFAVASIAASLILIMSIAGLVSRQPASEAEMYATFYEPYQTTGVSRSGNATMDNTLTMALQKFNAQEYESALDLFRQVIAFDSKNPVGHFYSGVSYQETGRFVQAIEEYETVLKDKDNLFIEQAEWYIGLCYLQTQERKKAYRQLERISKSESYYSKKADAIIRRLKFIE